MLECRKIYSKPKYMSLSGYFHLLGMRKTRKYIPCSKAGLDLWKWLRVKETSKMETAFTKNIDITNLQSSLLKQYWPPFFANRANIYSMLGAIW